MTAIQPQLWVDRGRAAITFYERAFGAQELSRMPFPSPDGTLKIGHAALRIGDSTLYLSDECPQHGSLGPGGSSPVTLHLYVTDADAAFARAVDAGASVSMPLADMFWGDRYGRVKDPFGFTWSIGGPLKGDTQ